MSRTIYVYKVKCLTDNKYECWKLYDTDPEPTTCPVDNNHTIDPNDVTRISVIRQNEFKIKEEDVPTGGKWRAQSYWIQGSTGPSETTTDLTFPNPITVLNIQYRSKTENEKDQIDLYVEPKDTGNGIGVIGVLQADASIGSTQITVSQDVIDNVMVADFICVTDGVNMSEYRNITSIDRENRILHFDGALTNGYNTSTPTYIKFRKYVLRDYYIGPADSYVLGATKIGGSNVATGNHINIVYKNNSSESKELFTFIEYLE